MTAAFPNFSARLYLFGWGQKTVILFWWQTGAANNGAEKRSPALSLPKKAREIVMIVTVIPKIVPFPWFSQLKYFVVIHNFIVPPASMETIILKRGSNWSGGSKTGLIGAMVGKSGEV